MASPMQGTASAPVKKAPRTSLLRSCERCRKRKIRCDDYFPCAACTRLGLQCKLSEERKAERSQTFLEERVKRLESLLAQHENRASENGGALLYSGPASPSGSLSTAGPSPHLRLQISTAPSLAAPPTSEDTLSSPGPGFQDYRTGCYTASYCSSPVDLATSPAGDLPPWASPDAFSRTDQASFFDYPRRANSFPSIASNNFTDLGSSFPIIDQGQLDSITLPDIPTIEVTSWETQSNLSNDGGIHDMAFNMPDLSVGSWSGPPSPSLTAVSHSYGNDEYLSEIDLDLRSRRSSIAFSDRPLSGSDSLKPAVPLSPAFSHSRPRSRSDVLPQSARYLDMTFHSFHSELDYRHSLTTPLGPDSGQVISGVDEALYSGTFFERIHPYFPVLSSQTFQSYVNPRIDIISSEQNTDLDRFKVLLVLAIGSRFQSNAGVCQASISDVYFRMAQQLYPTNAWQQDPSLARIQAHILLAIYTLLSTYSPSFIAGESPSHQNATNPNIWMVNAITIASSIELDLHSRQDLDELEQDTFISVFVLDQVVGMLLGKPNLIRGLNVDIDRLRRVQRTAEVNRMMMDERANEDVGSGWRCVLEWYRTVGRNFVL